MIHAVAADRYAATRDFRVSASAAQDQEDMVLASLGTAGFIAAWVDGSGNGAVLAQRFNLDGRKIGAEMVIAAGGGSPSVAANGAGGFVVTWTAQAPYPDVFNVIGQIYDAGGAKVGAQFVANTATTGFQTNSVVTALAGGGFVVTWLHDDGSSSEHIRAQVFAADGSRVGAEFVATDSWQGDKSSPEVVGLAGGGFVIAWFEVHGILGASATSGSDSRAQLFDPAGNKLGAAFKLHPELIGTQGHPALAALPGGGFVAAWSDNGDRFWGGSGPSNGNQGIWIQMFDSAGAKVGPPVQNFTGAASADTPSIAVTSTGFIVTWREYVPDDSAGAQARMQAQAFDLAGSKVGGMFKVDGGSAAEEFHVDAIGLGNGAVVIGWTSRAGGDEDVRARMLFPAQPGTAGDDMLGGTPSREFFLGYGGSDSIGGGGESDTIIGGAGNDMIDGGGGIDTAIVGSGAVFAPTGPGWTVTSSDGTDTLAGIEIVQGPAANTLLVGSGGFATIQAAVNSASDGDTILIAAGTYIEQVVVNDLDNLTIRAASGAQVTVQAPADVLETVRSSTGREIHAVVTVIGSRNVTIEGIDVDGRGVGNTVDEGTGPQPANFFGIYYRNSSGGLVDVDVTGTRDPYAAGTTSGGNPLLGGERRGVGVGTDNDFNLSFGPLLPFTMTGGSISDFQSDAAIFRRSDLIISGVTVTGNGAQTVMVQHGFQVISSTGTIADNVITAIGFAGATFNSGLIYATGSTSLNINGNQLVGANLENQAARVIGIAFLNTNSNGGSVTGNAISHVDNAIYFYGNFSNSMVIEENAVADSNGMDGIRPGIQFEVSFPESGTPHYIEGTALADSVTGAAGNDRLSGLAGDDGLSGRGGADHLEGGDGADVVDGGQGDDALLGDGGDDRLIGGEGKDSYSGGEGTDSIDFSGESGPITVNLSSNSGLFSDNPLATRPLNPGEALDSFGNYESVSGIENLILGAGHDFVLGGDAANRFEADAGDDILLGAGGNDVLLAGSGFDFLGGGLGNDWIEGGAGDDEMDGGAGDDRMDGGSGDDIALYSTAAAGVTVSLALPGVAQDTGGAGVDTLVDIENLTGSAHADILTGNALANVLRGLGGADSMHGGDGDDTYFVTDAGDSVNEAPAQGTDTLRTSLTVYSLAGLANVENLGATGPATARDFRGNGSNNVLTGGGGNDFLRLQDGGNDTGIGGGGNDVFLFGSSMDGSDVVDGGAGLDQIALQGGSPFTFGTGVVGIESLGLLSGSDTRFGGPGGLLHSYGLTTVDANVAAGVQLTVDGAKLRSGEDLTFNGSAETDGSFFIYGGRGVDTLTGGAKNDVFLFGSDGHFGASDVINGGSAGTDQLALRGNYSLTFGAGQLIGIESIGILSAHDTRFGPLGSNYNYNLTTQDGNVASGVQMTVDGAKLRGTETLVFNGSAETDGMFRIFGGINGDTLTAGQGADILQGHGGADMLAGGGGADTFRYASVSDSSGSAFDRILDFAAGSDKIDLSRIDANSLIEGNQAFSFIGSNAFSGSAGQLRAYQSGSDWFVEGDLNGDGTADFVIGVTMQGPTPLGAGDFLL